jgi:4-hydroxybenzoate polyprenyltransferase
MLWAARPVYVDGVLQASWHPPTALQAGAVVLMSVGLYGFGMSLNDIIDRRRDTRLAAHRPLPSGRIGVRTAHVICAGLGLMAAAAAFYYSTSTPWGYRSLLLVIGTGVLIASYDLAGKYLVGLGLLTLGLIRFFHAAIPAPQIPLLWHPLLLLNHVTILSTVGYHWEQKRPPLNRLHWFFVLGSLAGIDAAAVMMVWWKRSGGVMTAATFAQSLWVRPGLALPLAAAAVFVVVAWLIWRRSASHREAGQDLMLYGLLWLIVYDTAFVAGYVGPGMAAVIFLLLPVAYLSVQVMRWWGKLVALTHRPEFRRVET